MPISQAELDEFRRDAAAWFHENTPRDPGFLLPLTFMEVGTDQQFEFLREWQRRVHEAGYLGAAWPQAYGGHGMDPAFQSIATDEMRKARAPIMLNAIGLNWTGPLLLEIGSEELKRQYIPGILSAEDIWCQGYSEPEHGSDLGNAQTRAVKDGNEYVINGSKIWTTHGSYADYMILLARTDPEAPNKYAGLSFFLIPMKIDGVETVPIRKLTGEFGFTQTFFTDARVPATCIVREEGDGWPIAMRILEFERGAASGQAGGYIATQITVRDVIELARKSQRSGRPVMEDPVIRDQLVQFLIEEQGMVMNSARANIQPLITERPMALPLMSKAQSTEFIRRLNDFAISLQGTSSAYYVGDPSAVDGGFWQRGYLNAFSATIGGGTTQIQKNIIGDRVLGLPRN